MHNRAYYMQFLASGGPRHVRELYFIKFLITFVSTPVMAFEYTEAF